MAATSRKVARKALALVINTALTGVGQPIQVVYNYEPISFTEAPVVIVRSKKSKFERQGIGNTASFNKFLFDIFIYVAAETNGTYTASAAADLLDDIEAAIRNLIITNPTNAAWRHLEIPEDVDGTETFYLKSSDTNGLIYNVEVVTVEVTIYDT